MSGKVDFIAAGGNRHPSAAGWSNDTLAFGAGPNVALWNPEGSRDRGVHTLLTGHADDVTAVELLELEGRRLVVTGSADKTVRIWDLQEHRQKQCLEHHSGSINAIAVLPQAALFATGSADGTVKIWRFVEGEAALIQSIALRPSFIPLTCALVQLSGGAVALAVAGTTSLIQIYACAEIGSHFELQATLTGHEGWVRSLEFVEKGDEDFLLASASQDKYVRLWRLRLGHDASALTGNGSADPAAGSAKKSLSNKAHEVGKPGEKYSVTFEALLIGHEDWIYTVRWAPRKSANDPLILLSASADNSLAMWKADPVSGVWVCQTRLGEISAQKGSTTATGSTGGFWIGLWQPDGQGVVSLGRTGSWRRWIHDSPSNSWVQQVGISGHTKEVQSLAWSRDGSYFLSTGLDQTTRLWSTWEPKSGEKPTWNELSRPQIHGYDLNCIDAISSDRFVSGADEKLLRVFDKPQATADLLHNLNGIAETGPSASSTTERPDGASIPVLGLSNKAIHIPSNPSAEEDPATQSEDQAAANETSATRKTLSSLSHPPFEEHLARHTLWPEAEKLYGHGYEISCVAASHDGTLVATACKASSIDHAVIRLYETTEWREVKPPLTAHSLTVTGLQFSQDDKHLLSVGRDRRWTVFARSNDDPHQYKLLTTDPKGHSRMILACAWAPRLPNNPSAGPIFATASRDKTLKLWRLDHDVATCVATHPASAPVTALAFTDLPVQNASDPAHETYTLAYGTENGDVEVLDRIDAASLQIAGHVTVDKDIAPARAVNTLKWRPTHARGARDRMLAVASDDAAVRVYSFD